MHSVQQQPFPTLPQPRRNGSLFLLSFILTACPGTGATPMSIAEVIVDGDPTTLEVTLDIRGRGFGLGQVNYDLSEGTGVAQDPELKARFYNKGGLSRTFERDALMLMSPQRLLLPLDLSQPLPLGVYFVELTDGRGQTATSEPLFELKVVGDGGVEDTGLPRPDGGPLDATPDLGFPDGGLPDAQPEDLGFPDSGLPPDSGLGPFVGAYGWRAEVRVSSTVPAVAGTTIKVPIPHLSLMNAGQAQAAAGDLTLYQGASQLAFQWDDGTRVGTNDLAMIARLAADLPANGDPASPLVLYFGDPAATNTPSDSVFELALRFTAPVAPVNSGNGNAWHVADFWGHCPFDRTVAGGQAAFNGAYCNGDFADFIRGTLGTPRVTTITVPPPANTVYAASLFLAGRMIDGPLDILYLAHGPVNNNFAGALSFPTATYTGFAPNGSLTFEETTGNNRTEDGWRMDPVNYQEWSRAEVRFSPAIDQPSFQFRYISLNNEQGGNSFVALDDFWIRRALEPDFGVTLGPTEPRNP